jgi:hypothetical protein
VMVLMVNSLIDKDFVPEWGLLRIKSRSTTAIHRPSKTFIQP